MDAKALQAGDFIGDYRLLEKAGAGGFSVVFKADRPPAATPFAVKVPLVAEHVDHLRAEARLLAHIEDPQIVTVVEAHLEHDPPFLVMPWIEGEDLALPIAPPAPRRIVEALETTLDIARVLERLHAKGLAHGDVKPGNVRIGTDRRCRLLDLGLARAAHRTRGGRSLAQSLASTDGRSIAGTLDYLAPEVLSGSADPGPAADVYALGVLLHHLLTGRPPGFGVSPSSLNPVLPPGTEALLRDMLVSDPAARAAAPTVVAAVEALVRAERRCLARRNGHERRRVFQRRMRTLQRGLDALALLVVIGVGAFVLHSLAARGLETPTGPGPEPTILPLLILPGIVLVTIGVLLGVTTINAWVIGVPEKRYKNRPGHRLWSFMMQ